MPVNGYIFDIKKYSINDGPGIRTTIFFKGCPLNCWWCHNPESQKIEPEEFEGCTFRWNLSYEGNNKNIVGKKISVADVMKEIEKDIPFYEESKGGVTFSGGEPLLQIDFLIKLLKECNKKGISTAVDTSGYSEWENFKKIYELVDLFLFDLKIVNEQKHIEYTGVSNKLIHDNLKHLTELGNKVTIRIPVIPSVTDTKDNLEELVNFISSLKKIKGISLLPFHKTAYSKYNKMRKQNKIPDLEPLTNDEMNKIKDRFSLTDKPVIIEG